jgi:c-di-GMP-binding flagellar brake protein YcgR
MTDHDLTLETDADTLQRALIGEASQRRRQLQLMVESRAVVALHGDPGSPAPEPTAIPARARSIDLDRGVLEFDLGGEDGAADMLRRADHAVAVCAAGGVKLQFELTRLTLLSDGTQTRLRAPLPATVARIQRRDAFRVQPPAHVQARLWLHGPKGESPMRIVDVSATGVSFEVPEGDCEAVPGDRYRGCRLELPANAPIRCELIVRSVRRRPKAPPRIGCEFDGLDPTSARAVQVFVNLAQVNGRRAVGLAR